MKASLTIFGVLLFKLFHASLNSPVIYTEITDCGDGKLTNFVASVTPNPLSWMGKLDSTFWVGGRLSFTEEAKIFASNISAGDFNRDLRINYILEEPSWASIPDFLKPKMELYNNSSACGGLIVPEFCLTIQQGMISSLTNAPVFFSHIMGLNEHPFVLNFMDVILKQAQIKIRFQLKLALHGHTLFCARFAIKTAPNDDISGSVSEYRSKNIQHAFDTSKVINVFGQNKTYSCPENSKEISNSSCECIRPFSGPLCSFQCWYDEIITSLCPGGSDEGTYACTFRDQNYIKYCIKEKNVQFLNGPITVDIVSLNHINIKWKLIHFLFMHKYELTLQDNTGNIVGSIVNKALHLKGLETSYSLGSLCLNEAAYGVDCRNTTSAFQSCFNCSDLSLKPFHDYTIVLKLGTGHIKDRMSLVEYVTTAVNFSTPEVDVTAPKVISAALDEDQNYVSVDWTITDLWCPGYIRRYELLVYCSSDHAITSGNLHFDCRSSNQGPKLNATVPGNCKREDFFIKLRIGTANSTSEESELFPVKNEAFSTWLIIAYILGAFLIVVAVGLGIFFYYYKRHIKIYQNVHQTLLKLRRIQRKSEIGQSFRDRIAPKSTIPDIPKSNNSPGTTVFQTMTTITEVGTPRSLESAEIHNETASNTPRDSFGYKLFEIQLETATTTPRDSFGYKLTELP